MRPEYASRLAARRNAALQHEGASHRLGNARLLAVLAGLLLAWWSLWFLAAAIGIFVVLIIWHEKIARAAAQEQRAIAFYERALSRLDGNWSGAGATGERYLALDHPYAADLDIFGTGSLFQLMNSARTSAGEQRLASWLSAAADAAEISSRQDSIADLRPRIDLREDLALLGEEVQAEVHPNHLLRWAQQPAVPTTRVQWISFGFTVLFLSTLTGFFVKAWIYVVPILVLLLQSGFSLWLRERQRKILASAEMPARDLRTLGDLLRRLEREQFKASRLLTLQADLRRDATSASREIGQLRRLIELHDWARNFLFGPIAAALLWSTHLAFAIERWRQRHGHAIVAWLNAVAEIEALNSIAGYAAERPDQPFPELLETGPVFDARALRHPFLPSASAVPNDIRLDHGLQLLLVSGSNMSGKSTLLRAVGINTVLAWAGAPVSADRLSVSRLNVGAAIRVQDSIQDGKSRFYSEIMRLRQILDLLGKPEPLLFLLDELLSGTNSHDRRIGAEAIARALVAGGAIGLLTTHDLALAHIAETLQPHAENVHFEDHIESGRIAFDFRMRPGIVKKSNALELMRSVGLPV